MDDGILTEGINVLTVHAEQPRTRESPCLDYTCSALSIIIIKLQARGYVFESFIQHTPNASWCLVVLLEHLRYTTQEALSAEARLPVVAEISLINQRKKLVCKTALPDLISAELLGTSLKRTSKHKSVIKCCVNPSSLEIGASARVALWSTTGRPIALYQCSGH